MADDSKIRALCRTLYYNSFSDSFLPPLQYRPYLQESYILMFKFLTWGTGYHYSNRDYIDYNTSVRYRVKNRAFFTTKKGNIGLAPRRTKTGDLLYIVLGCQLPMVLRVNEFGNYIVVGECYLDGYIDGIGLTGKLSSNWQCVERYNPDLKNHYAVFIDRNAGIVQIEDPRLRPLPPR